MNSIHRYFPHFQVIQKTFCILVSVSYTWNTPVLKSLSMGAWFAAFMPSDITVLVSTGSMISSTHNLAAA
jgi:hypothetical protein